MKNKYPFTKTQLTTFLNLAGKATYASNGKEEEQSERPGFIELIYSDGDFFYRDSYVGYYHSRGMEVVRHKGKPIWTSLYGGGITEGNKEMTYECFEFLKKALRTREKDSMRGKPLVKNGDWEYTYQQVGDIFEFSGHEQIFYKGKLVFFHKTIGGIVEDK
jgi:hypothetical protein